MTDDKGASKSWKWATERENMQRRFASGHSDGIVEGGLKWGESEERKCITKLL